MKSAIHRIATLAAIATTAISGTFTAVAPALSSQFGQQEVDQSKFIAVAAPYRGGSAHQLLVLEQVSNSRQCWSESGAAPTQVEPLLLNFDFTGICGRSTDSNGYSIRVNGDDLGLQYSLRVVRRDGDMVLVGAPNNRANPEIVIGRTHGETPEFAKIDLEPGWRFTKRKFGDSVLGHVYLTFEGDLGANPGDGGTDPGNGGTDPGNGGTTNPRFPDTRNDIYMKEIDEAVSRGFIAGFSEDNTFRPQATLTREQLVSMVLEALNKLPNANLNIPTSTATNPYRDVDASRWSAAKIQFAREIGLVSGYEDGTFRPAQPVTRAEMIAVLRRAAMYGQNLAGQGAELGAKQEAVNFTDTASHWANNGITEMSAYCGVASPLNESGSSFFPDQASQRNYAAAATLRMLKCVTGELPAAE